VGYLERSTNPGAKARIEQARRQMIAQASKQAVPMPDAELTDEIRHDIQVKRPGEKKWISAADPKAQSVVVIFGPDGSAATQVDP